MNVEEYFGVSAGKVWQALSEANAMEVNELSKKTKLRVTEVLGGLGWLAREGKVAIEEKNRAQYYKLVG